MFPNIDLVQQNKIVKLEKDIVTVNSDINAIESDISTIQSDITDLQNKSGGSTTLLEKYLVEEEWDYIDNSIGIYGVNNWWRSAAYPIYTIPDYNSDVVRDCARLRCNSASAGSYTSLYKYGGRLSSGINTTFLNKLTIEPITLTNGVTETLIGIANDPTPTGHTKGVFFRLMAGSSGITVTTRTKDGAKVVTNTHATDVNSTFNKYKMVVNGLTNVQFYIDDVLIDTISLSGFTASDMYFVAIVNNSVLDSSSGISATAFIDYTRIESEYLSAR